MTQDDLARVCHNCNASFPSEPFQSDFAICLYDPEFEPFVDELLETQDFSRCKDLVSRKRFAWDREACEDFDPVEDVGEDWAPELTAKVGQMLAEGRLTPETLREVILEDKFRRTDWSQVPVDVQILELRQATTHDDRREALNQFGFFVGKDNKAAFDGLCEYMRALPPASTLEDKTLRIDILRQLRHTREYKRELAQFLVEDLLRTASTPRTRGWYSEVLGFFERSCLPGIAEEVLPRMLQSPHFSYRIKKRVRAILEQNAEEPWF